MEKRSFYRVYGFKDKLTEGAKLQLEHTVEYDCFYRDVPEMAPLIILPEAELVEKRKASVKLEKEIYAKMQNTIKEWEKQAAQTLLLDKALEYARTPKVKHTSNEWKQRKDGSWEISNLVYKMTYKIWEDVAGDKKGTWLISWKLEMNRPPRPSTEKMFHPGDPAVAEQNKKRYDTLDAAQRYIQGRFDLYTPLFTELCPPIPDKFEDIFRINGSLLPGYTIAPPEKTDPDKETVDALLNCLGAEDIAAPKALVLDTQPPDAGQPAAAQKVSESDKPPAPFKPRSVRKNGKKANRKKKRTTPER